MTNPLVFFLRERPLEADIIDLVLEEKRVFVGYPAWRENEQFYRDSLSKSLISPALPPLEWTATKALIEDFSRSHTMVHNLVQEVSVGSIVLVPRADRGCIYAGRIANEFEIIDAPPWRDRYLNLRKDQGLRFEPEQEYIGDVVQSWKVVEFVSLPFPLVPTWIRKSLFGRSQLGRIHPNDDLKLDPYEVLDTLLEDPTFRPQQHTSNVHEVEKRLVEGVSPLVFEHLVVALMQLENPDETWIQVGGSGDGGCDGLGYDVHGNLIGAIQCKWEYWGDELPFMLPADSAVRRIIAALLHPNCCDIVPIGAEFLSRQRIAELVLKHHANLPLALTLRIGGTSP